MLNDKGTDQFSKEHGYEDTHDLKKDYLRGERDNVVGHYDIYNNSTTGESFLINKNQTVIIPIN